MNDNFDENIDYYEIQQEDADLERMNKAMQRKMARDAQARQQQIQAEAFNEGLKESGLTPEEFQNVLNTDPEGATQEFRSGIKNYIKNVAKRRRDPHSGQYVKGSTPDSAPDGKWSPTRDNIGGKGVKYNVSDDIKKLANSPDQRDQRSARDAMINDIVEGLF